MRVKEIKIGREERILLEKRKLGGKEGGNKWILNGFSFWNGESKSECTNKDLRKEKAEYKKEFGII